MPFVYREVNELKDHALIGTGDCVVLIKEFVPALAKVSTSAWRAGARVVDVKNLARGTAIATFVEGRYPRLDTGNHAAFYIASAGAGFYVMEQWKNDKSKPRVSMRLIRPGLTKRDGSLREPSNAAQAFYMIELSQ
jgi:hypothetical protein